VVDDDGGEEEEEGEDGDDNDDDDNDEDEDDGDFFRKKEKTQRELQEEERDFERFLTKQAVKAAPKAGDDLLLHSYLERETTDEKEMFLRDFVLNNGWLARGSSAAPKVDDYKIEVDNTNVTKKLDDREGEGHGIASGEEGIPSGGDVDSDFDDKLDEFEHRYNFRFEEPGGTEVVSHARTIDGSMRRPDDRRKAVREARKKRKQHEKLVKTEEIKHLKNVKKREIEARLVALQDAAGDGANFAGFDLDAEFDPDEFNRQMESRFGDEYYEQQDAEMMTLQDEDVVVASEARLKPNLPKSDSEDGDDNRDAPLREEVERLMDEYYSLDYEDIIGGTPVRFKYKKVDKETFDMDPAEILVADDKELNRAVSLKYLAPYRSKSSIPKRAVKQAKRARFGAAAGADDVAHRGRLRQHDDKDASKEKDRSRKKREKRKSRECDASGETTERDGDESEEKPERKKKKRKAEDSTASSVKAETGDNDSPTKRKKSKVEKKKHRKECSDHAAAVMPASRRAAYGL
jgi:protein KRI1